MAAQLARSWVIGQAPRNRSSGAFSRGNSLEDTLSDAPQRHLSAGPSWEDKVCQRFDQQVHLVPRVVALAGEAGDMTSPPFEDGDLDAVFVRAGPLATPSGRRAEAEWRPSAARNARGLRTAASRSELRSRSAVSCARRWHSATTRHQSCARRKAIAAGTASQAAGSRVPCISISSTKAELPNGPRTPGSLLSTVQPWLMTSGSSIACRSGRA